MSSFTRIVGGREEDIPGIGPTILGVAFEVSEERVDEFRSQPGRFKEGGRTTRKVRDESIVKED